MLRANFSGAVTISSDQVEFLDIAQTNSRYDTGTDNLFYIWKIRVVQLQHSPRKLCIKWLILSAVIAHATQLWE